MFFINVGGKIRRRMMQKKIENEPLVSIIIPVYNVAAYLQRCIDSVLGQTYENIEILLIDDGSTDDSANICDEYAQKHTNVQAFHKKNGGLSDARNYGMKYATGKWLTFVDSDDVLSFEFVSTLVRFAREDELDIAVCNFCQFFEEDLHRLYRIRSSERKYVWDGEAGTKVLLYQKKFTTSAWGKLYKLDLFSNIFFPKGKLHEDVGTIYKVFERAQRIGYLDKKMYYYLQRSKSITHSGFSEKKMDYILQTREMIEYFENNNDKLLFAAISRHFSACFQVILECPEEEMWKKEYGVLKQEIGKYASTVMCDGEARLKNRMIARIADKNVELAVKMCKWMYRNRRS